MKTSILLKRYGIKLKRSLGQNFLSDERIAERIVDAVDLSSEDFVVEIGAGAGTLTEEILKRGANVVAFEIDESLRELLEDRLGNYGNLKLIFEDFLKYDLSTFGENTIYMGNIPYHITSPLLEKLLLDSPGFKFIVLMVQKELAGRIMCEGRSRNFSSLSVLVNLFCKVEKLFDVSRSHFIPNPNVESTVLKLTPRVRKEPKNVDEFLRFSRLLFSMRRKKIKNSLTMKGHRGYLERIQETPLSWVLERRIEELDLDVLIELFKLLEEGEESKKD